MKKKTMKLYRFRPLADECDFFRAKYILETGYFWCSSFWDLNDPMEGVFGAKNRKEITDVFSEKNKYKICSFSGQEGFENPTLWGYYANGYKGMAIEIEVEVDKESVRGVSYLKKNPNAGDVGKILSSKFKSWEHECEYRFLTNCPGNFHKIGEKITAVYFGDPYGNVENKDEVKQKNEKFAKYDELKEKLIEVAKRREIKRYRVYVSKGKIKCKKI